MDPVTPTTPALSFDQQVCNKIKEAFANIFLQHPEVKTLGCVISWGGDLNDAKIAHGVWVTPDGPIRTPEAVLGSMHQTLRLLDAQLKRAEEIRAALFAEVVDLGNKVINAKKEEEQKPKT